MTLVLGVEEELQIRRMIEAEALRHDVYFVRVSREMAQRMKDWSGPVQMRFEYDEHRDGEGQLIFRKVES